MIQQNISIAQSVLEKVNKNKSSFDSVILFESFSEDEMREFLLYCIYPAKEDGSYEPLPRSDLFPHNVAFSHLHPRESEGYQIDSLYLLKSTIFYEPEKRRQLKKNLSVVSNNLFREIVEDKQEDLEILEKILHSFLRLHDMFDSLLIDTENLGSCLMRKDFSYDIHLRAITYIGCSPRSLCEIPDELIIGFLFPEEASIKEKQQIVRVVFNLLVYRRLYVKAISHLVHLEEWFDITDEWLLSKSVMECILNLQKISVRSSQKEGKCSRAIGGTDWLIQTIAEFKPDVQKGFSKLVRKSLLDPRLSDVEIGNWIKTNDELRISQLMLFGGKENSQKLHEAIDKVLS